MECARKEDRSRCRLTPPLARGRRSRPRSGLDGAHPRPRPSDGQRWATRISPRPFPYYRSQVTALPPVPTQPGSPSPRSAPRGGATTPVEPRMWYSFRFVLARIRPQEGPETTRPRTSEEGRPTAAPPGHPSGPGDPPSGRSALEEGVAPGECDRDRDVGLVATDVEVAGVDGGRSGEVAALVDHLGAPALHRRARRQELDLLVLEHGVSSDR